MNFAFLYVIICVYFFNDTFNVLFMKLFCLFPQYKTNLRICKCCNSGTYCFLTLKLVTYANANICPDFYWIEIALLTMEKVMEVFLVTFLLQYSVGIALCLERTQEKFMEISVQFHIHINQN